MFKLVTLILTSLVVLFISPLMMSSLMLVSIISSRFIITMVSSVVAVVRLTHFKHFVSLTVVSSRRP